MHEQRGKKQESPVRIIWNGADIDILGGSKKMPSIHQSNRKIPNQRICFDRMEFSVIWQVSVFGR